MKSKRIYLLLFFALMPMVHPITMEAGMVPHEPVEIGTTPQFFIDAYIVDNRWGIKYAKEAVLRAFHQPKKYEHNPVIANDGGYVSVAMDEETGLFRMWYQTSYWAEDPTAKKGSRPEYAIAYAESKDGIRWERPKLGLYEWKGSRDNNIVWKGILGKRASGHCILGLPEKERRGYRYIMSYRTGGVGKENEGIHLIGSHDGIHWDEKSDMRIAYLHSDTQNSIVYDRRRKEYVMYCRAKHIYRGSEGDIIDTGASRRVARMASKELWTEWNIEPQNILIPDELDVAQDMNFFYGMPTTVYADIYWGFLWPFKMNSEIHSELAFSRDGISFARLPTRPKLIELGPPGAWDSGMVFSGHQWIEVSDEWWMYYAGWNGPHGSRDRSPGIGLITLRKEGFISMRGPKKGGVICTRTIKWPGGSLLINADAHEGEIKVRLSDEKRKVLPGFDYGDCMPFKGDSVSHQITWKEKTVSSLAGRVIRLEFLLTNADIYTFRAAGKGTDN